MGAYSDLRILALFPKEGEIKSFFDSKKVIWRQRTYCLEGDFHQKLSEGEFDLVMHLSFRIDIPGNFNSITNPESIINLIKNLWDEEAYWEVHDLLEERWKISKGEEKRKLWILIQLVISQIKWQMGQRETSENIINRNMKDFMEFFGSPMSYSYPVKISEEQWTPIEKLIQSNI